MLTVWRRSDGHAGGQGQVLAKHNAESPKQCSKKFNCLIRRNTLPIWIYDKSMPATLLYRCNTVTNLSLPILILIPMTRYRSGSRLVEEAGGRLRVRTGVMEGGRTAVSILTIDGVRHAGRALRHLGPFVHSFQLSATEVQWV